MRHHPSKQNIVWTVLFSLLMTLSLSGCGDSNNVSAPSGPVPLSPDAKLSSLTVTPGTLQPAFLNDVTNYTVDVLTSVTSVTVAAQPQTAGATVNINGQATTSRSVNLGAAGSSTVVTIVVTALSGSQNTYIVTVNRAAPASDNNLSALSVTGQTLAPAFNATILNYTVDVATTVTQVNVSATKSDPNAVLSGSLTAGAGVATGQATIPLGGPGSSTPVTLLVTAPNNSQKTYTVIVNRAAPGGNNNLSALSVLPGLLAPPFDASVLDYTVDVASTVTQVNVSATKADPNAVMSGSLTAGAGVATGQATIPLGGPGSSTPITITVTAPNGIPKTYSVTVNRAAPASDNNLSALSVTGQTLAPSFNPNVLDYTVDVATTVTQVNVSATKSDPNAVMSGSLTAGAGVATGQATIPLGGPGSSTPITLLVTAQNGLPKTYSVTVNRAAPAGNNNLSSLVVSAGALVPAFDAAILNYDVAVPNTTADTTITATVEDSTATLTINGLFAASGSEFGPISLLVGSNSIPIVVTAGNGTPKTYTVIITRDP
jgi:hypothetical protein